jgi:flagellar FliJ protein
MKRFTFDLQKILELRQYREQETKIELGRAVGVLTALENQIADLARERVRAAGERFAGGAAEMRSYERYILRLDKTRDRLLEEAARAELKAAEARDLYLEASRDRKVIDKIRERRERDYHKETLAEDIKVMDEAAAGAKARRAVTGYRE